MATVNGDGSTPLRLDLGCGNGVPLTEALRNAGHYVVGLDSASGMLALFRMKLPGTVPPKVQNV